jgi:opacity protein-like surface antigen
MGNAYIDFGTWYGFTPYIGAGIGGAYVTMASYQMPPGARARRRRTIRVGT